MILRIGTALGNCEQEEVLKSHLIRIAIEEDCELDIADYRKELSKLWSAFTDLDLVFLDYALLRGAADSLYAFFRQNPDCMTVAVGTPKEEICSFLELRPAGHMEDADSFGQIRRLSCRCMERLRTENQVLQIHTRQGDDAVSMRSILYCQSDLKYVQITAKSGTVYRKLWKLDELLSILPEYFMRIHQSYVVNVREADAFDRTSHELQMTDGSRLPVSRPYLQAVQALFGAKSAVSGADSEM